MCDMFLPVPPRMHTFTFCCLQPVSQPLQSNGVKCFILALHTTLLVEVQAVCIGKCKEIEKYTEPVIVINGSLVPSWFAIRQVVYGDVQEYTKLRFRAVKPTLCIEQGGGAAGAYYKQRSCKCSMQQDGCMNTSKAPYNYACAAAGIKSSTRSRSDRAQRHDKNPCGALVLNEEKEESLTFIIVRGEKLSARPAHNFPRAINSVLAATLLPKITPSSKQESQDKRQMGNMKDLNSIRQEAGLGHTQPGQKNSWYLMSRWMKLKSQ
eukprot:1155229-Pelagomonas_calceolata.AAC.3